MHSNAKTELKNDLINALAPREDRTIGENIDARIAEMEREIERLKETKKKLASGTALTDMKPSELRRAMDF